MIHREEYELQFISIIAKGLKKRALSKMETADKENDSKGTIHILTDKKSEEAR